MCIPLLSANAKPKCEGLVTSNLSNMWLGLLTVLELIGGVRCVARVFVNLQFGRTCVLEQSTASAFGWKGDGFTEQCPSPKESVSCDRVGDARPCDRGPHVCCLLGKQQSSLGKGAVERSLWLCVFWTDNSRTLFPRRKWWTYATSRKEGSPEGGAGTGKTAWVEHTT